MKFKKFFATLFISFLAISIILVNPVNALSDVQKKAADINGDGKIDNQDLDLMVQIGYPDAPYGGKRREKDE